MRSRMRKYGKNIVSMMLALILIISLIPAGTAYAAQPDSIGIKVDQSIAVDRTVLGSLAFDGVTYNVTRDDDMAWRVLDILNKERADYGLPAFTMDRRLMDVAMGRAAEITVKFNHVRPNGTSCFSVYPMASAANGWNGLYACAENIAAGQTTPEEVMASWMDSSGHRKNILNGNYVSIGIGCVRMKGGYYFYWTQSFGDRVIEAAVRPNMYLVDGLDYSHVFDAEYYLNTYADLKAAFGNDEKKAFQHFLKYGMREGRQGNAAFNVHSYIYMYADLRKAFGNDLVKYYQHYLRYGRREGRITFDYSSIFDAAYYASKYPDLKAAFGYDTIRLQNHFISYGMREGRQASQNFNVTAYKNRYQDLRLAFGNDLTKYYIHYVRYGKREGRNGLNCPNVLNPVTRLNGVDYSAVYDFKTYQTLHPDVKKFFKDDDIGTLKHFIIYGMRERRQAKSSFNLYQYIVNYKDLRKAYKYDYPSYYLHFIKYGKVDGRKATGNATYSQAKKAIEKTIKEN